MDANWLLEESLNKLTAKLSELSADHLSEIQPIRDVLVAIRERGPDADSFVRDLIKLAAAVIDVRNAATNTALQGLPVPPYDLWLPFKAEDWTGSPPKELAAAVRILNEMVDEIDFGLEVPGSARVATERHSRVHRVRGGEEELG